MACFTWFHCDQNQRVAMFATPIQVPEGRPSSRAHLHSPHQRPGQQIVQSLFALREPDHDVADAQDHRGKPLRKMPSRGAFE